MDDLVWIMTGYELVAYVSISGEVGSARERGFIHFDLPIVGIKVFLEFAGRGSGGNPLWRSKLYCHGRSGKNEETQHSIYGRHRWWL
jgi:hypothetical protein